MSLTKKQPTEELTEDIMWNQGVMRGNLTAISHLAKEWYLAKIYENPELIPKKYQAIKEWVIQINEDKGEKVAKDIDCHYVYVTVNCKPSTSPIAFYQKVAQLKKVWMGKWIACIEYHTSGQNHVHMHLVCAKAHGYQDKKKSQIVTEFYNTFRQYCNSKACIEVQMLAAPHDKLLYVMGQKFVAEKQPLVEKDKLWRASIGIPDVVGSWADCLEGSGATDLVETGPQSPIAPEDFCDNCGLDIEGCACSEVSTCSSEGEIDFKELAKYYKDLIKEKE